MKTSRNRRKPLELTLEELIHVEGLVVDAHEGVNDALTYKCDELTHVRKHHGLQERKLTFDA